MTRENTTRRNTRQDKIRQDNTTHNETTQDNTTRHNTNTTQYKSKLDKTTQEKATQEGNTTQDSTHNTQHNTTQGKARQDKIFRRNRVKLPEDKARQDENTFNLTKLRVNLTIFVLSFIFGVFMFCLLIFSNTVRLPFIFSLVFCLYSVFLFRHICVCCLLLYVYSHTSSFNKEVL
jgi:hypothetical protein